jgi:hypothetical protein
MSQHREKTPLTEAINEGLRLHMLAVDKPSQLSDAFRAGYRYADSRTPSLAVWYGAMPESNGKSNWTAILYRKSDGPFGGAHVTIDRSEYPDRVRYEADRVRFLIGELEKEPFILDYDADKVEAPFANHDSKPQLK